MSIDALSDWSVADVVVLVVVLLVFVGGAVAFGVSIIRAIVRWLRAADSDRGGG